MRMRRARHCSAYHITGYKQHMLLLLLVLLHIQEYMRGDGREEYSLTVNHDVVITEW